MKRCESQQQQQQINNNRWKQTQIQPGETNRLQTLEDPQRTRTHLGGGGGTRPVRPGPERPHQRGEPASGWFERLHRRRRSFSPLLDQRATGRGARSAARLTEQGARARAFPKTRKRTSGGSGGASGRGQRNNGGEF